MDATPLATSAEYSGTAPQVPQSISLVTGDFYQSH